MAVARLDLTRPGIRSRLALTGGVLTVLGYGGSWLALHLVPHALSVISSATGGGSASSAWWSDTVGEPENGTPLTWLLVAAPHSQTTLSVLGNTGVAFVVIAGCLTVADRMPRLTRLATPVSAVGAMALTAYVLHIVALWLLTDVWPVAAVEDETMSGLAGAARLHRGHHAAGHRVEQSLQARSPGTPAAHGHPARAVRQVASGSSARSARSRVLSGRPGPARGLRGGYAEAAPRRRTR